MKLSGRAVWLGRGPAINALSFPAIMTCLRSFWFLDHQAERERESQEDRSTEGQTEKAGHSGHRNKPQKKNLASWSNERRLAHRIILVQHHNPSATLDWGFNSSNIVFYRQLQNCKKWCSTLEYSSSTVSLLRKSIMCTFKRHFCSCLLANT